MILYKDADSQNWIAESEGLMSVAPTRSDSFRLLLVMLKIDRQTESLPLIKVERL